MNEVIVVFDIGKTNKKMLLYNQNWEIIRESEVRLEEREDDDGFMGDSLSEVKQWLDSSWQTIERDKSIEVMAVNFTTYGASFVHLDINNKPVTPLYNYLKPYPNEILDHFYQTYGDAITFASQTASPSLGMLNSGLQIFWIKHHKPHLFKQIKTSLHFPQYCAFLFSGKLSTEMTSIGCHTGLWDFKKQDYHEWIYKENLQILFPNIAQSYTNGFAKFREKNITCGVGLHDSSAALIPYKSLTTKKFILLSTGTWGITLNPFAHFTLTPDDLAQDCLYYMTFEGKPVRASRFFLGNQHERLIEKLNGIFNVQKNFYQSVRCNSAIVHQLKAQNKVFDETNMGDFQDYAHAYHALVGSLAQRQAQAIQLAIGDTLPEVMFVDGGFAKNDIFMEFMRLHFPKLDILQKSFVQGTSLGAASVLKSWEQ